MKKVIAMVLCLVMVLSLAACGERNNDVSSTSSQAEVSDAGTAGQMTNVKRENGQVSYTISADMLEIMGVTADDMMESTEGSERITKNDDGSITCVVTEEEYDQLLSTLKSTMDETISSIQSDESLEGCVENVVYNDDLSEIVITANREAYEANVSAFMVAPTLGLAGMIYQMYTGLPDDAIECKVSIQDAATGEEFDSVVYPDIMEETASEAAVSQ